jgi:cbb3-type cytochrome c oxidase subunit II
MLMLKALLKSGRSGWRGICLIAITYVYFLIFAQFAFLKRLALLGIADDHLKAVMGAMAAGGILLSLLAPRITLLPSPNLRLRTGLFACGIAACLILLPLGLVGSITVSFTIGCGLGLLTVTLVTYLRRWLGTGSPLPMVGLGTGIGYLICNFPALFTSSPQAQAVTAALMCVAGIGLTLIPDSRLPDEPCAGAQVNVPAVPFVQALAGFTALVWLDSAAFFIIQNTPELKAGTWDGTVHLWINGMLHFFAALASAWYLRRRGLSLVLSLAFFALAASCLLLLGPGRALLASAFYPVGVSLYSVALVAYPSLLAPAASVAERGRRAGWIYAIAGWFGSAMGIGMGQNLGHVPVAFVTLAGAIILVPAIPGLIRQRKREIAAVAVILCSALAIDRATSVIHADEPQISPAERGRQVYISEGCINCHSQYVRPNTPDVLMWGPATGVGELRRESPPLIGNRRQGPDLAEVGSRRSPLWLKAHFYNPSELSHGSFMPSYEHLFRDRRGGDLVSYLQSLHAADVEQFVATRSWLAAHSATAEADADDGARLFRARCATCHTASGATRNQWRTSFKRLPPDLKAGPFEHLQEGESAAVTMGSIAKIIKFGIAGTDMPGHEYYADRDIASISLWVTQNIVRPARDEQTSVGGDASH